MENPKVSIIIPAFNRAATLRQALRSALAQDYPNLEVIVADNASTDGTRQAVEELAESGRVVYRRNEKNLGMYENWRRALNESATGEWALILSDDDYLADTAYIGKAMRLAAANPGMLLISANYRTFYEAENRCEDRMREVPEVAGGKWHFLNHGVNGVGHILATTLFRKDAVKGFEFFSKPDLLACDALDFLRFGLHGQVGFIREPAAVIRAHAASQTSMADMPARFRSLDYIGEAYSYALEKGFLTSEELDPWKDRLVRRGLEAIFTELCEAGNTAGLMLFVKKIKLEQPRAIKYFFYPQNFLKAGLAFFPRLYRAMVGLKRAVGGRRTA